MKRIISAITAVFMLFTVFHFNVFAAEDDTSEYEELIDLACEIFPEHADKIKSKTRSSGSHSRNSVDVDLINSITRDVNENEFITYSEYSNGIVLLTDYTYSYYTTENESYTSAGGTYASVDIVATCSGGNSYYSYFKLDNLCFTLVSGAYDSINSTGTPIYSNHCYLYNPYDPILNESSSGPARIMYDLRFQVGPTEYQSHITKLTIYVGNNGLTINHALLP